MFGGIIMSILKNEMTKCGVRIIHLGPLGPNYSEKEWIKWLDYNPKSTSKKYEDKETCAVDRLGYEDYTTQKHLDSIISKKLTDEEYRNAREQIQEIVDTLSYDELEQYCELLKGDFDDLSMVDLFVLREISKVFLLKSSEKSSKQLTYQLKKNENMRYNSVIKASKDIIY